ncbi:unnamed protein product [Diamesa serratosioi]
MRVIGLLIVIVGLIGTCRNLTLEPIKYVKIREVNSYPVLKISYHAPQYPHLVAANSDQVHNKVKNYNRQNQKHTDIFSEQSDNVREFNPVSREEIKNVKRLTFHGRNSPNAQPSIGVAPVKNKTTPQTFQVNYQKQKYEQQQRIETQRRPVAKGKNAVKRPQIDKNPFFPLLRPSPINVLPSEPPSYDTIHNYVNYLKLRQKKYYKDVLDDSPAPLNKFQDPFEDEITYFVKREKELADEFRDGRQNILSTRDFGQNDRIGDSAHEIVDEGSREDFRKSDEFESFELSRKAGNQIYKLPENGDNFNADLEQFDDHGNYGEESRRREKFVPFRMYAQVRHVEAENHKPVPADNPKIKEKISLEKKNIYYSEQGHDDEEYDHGAAQEFSNYKEKSKYRRKRPKRSPRSLDDDLLSMPLALALVKKSDIPNLTGEKLLKHLDELIKNTSYFLPDEGLDYIDNKDFKSTKIILKKVTPDTIYGHKVNLKSSKYPYYTLPANVLSEMSAFRYAESMKNYPKDKESLYKTKRISECEDIDEDVDPVPKNIEDSSSDKKHKRPAKRLNHLGDKISCFKKKVFGKDPFDNPLFKEEYVAAAIPIPWKSSKSSNIIAHQANPLITVYDDVINNIRAGILEETKKNKEVFDANKEPIKVTQTESSKDLKKSSSETIAVSQQFNPVIGYNSIDGVSSQIPIFDISTFYPKFKIHINDDDDDDEDDGSAASELNKIKKNHKIALQSSKKTFVHNQINPVPNPIKKQGFQPSSYLDDPNGPNKSRLSGDYVMEYIEAPTKRIYKEKDPIQNNGPFRTLPAPNLRQELQQKQQQQQQHQQQQQARYRKPPNKPKRSSIPPSSFFKPPSPLHAAPQRQQIYHFKLL